MPLTRPKATSSAAKKLAAAPEKPEGKAFAVKVAGKRNTTVYARGLKAALAVDPGPLVNIAITPNLDAARRAARSAGILTQAGKLSPKYR